MAFNPYTAKVLPLRGKHYGTIIDLQDEMGSHSQIKVWIGNSGTAMSQRQLDDFGYSSNEEAAEDGMPCDCHYESERQYLLSQVIAEAITKFQLPSENS